MLALFWIATLISFAHCGIVPSNHLQTRQIVNPNPQPQPISINDQLPIGSSFFNSSNFPPPTLIVRQNTTHPGEFQTIQSAVLFLKNLTGPQVIYVHDGVYREQVYIDYPDPLIIRGRKPHHSMQNFVTLIFNLSAKKAKSNAASATLNVLKNDFALYYIDVVNAFGQGTDTQALALNTQGFRQGYYNSTFASFQDTVRVYKGVQYFSQCTITGAVDFIFSRDANAWFERISIPILKGSKETITASGRQVTDTSGFLVINNATVFSAGALPQSAYLGRPWGIGAKVAFQFSTFSDVINPAGWLSWHPLDPRTSLAQFNEFGNVGVGALGIRNYTSPLASAHLPENIMGADYLGWIDNNFRPILPDLQTNVFEVPKPPIVPFPPTVPPPTVPAPSTVPPPTKVPRRC